MIVVGVEAFQAAGRLRRGPQFAAVRDVPARRPRVEVPVEALMWSVEVPRPRMIGPVIAVVALAATTVLVASTRSVLGGLVGVVLAGAAVFTGLRAFRSELRLDGSAIVDRGVIRTRRWGWDEVYVAQNEDL
jgi:hypothetical protein